MERPKSSIHLARSRFGNDFQSEVEKHFQKKYEEQWFTMKVHLRFQGAVNDAEISWGKCKVSGFSRTKQN